MKLDIFKLVDILAVVAVALAWSHPVWAQAQDDATVEACRAKSRTVKADSPLKVVQAQKDAFDACVASSISDPQRRTLALFRTRQVMCNEDVKKQLTKDPLTTAYEQGEIYRKCMAPNYVVQ